MKTAIVTDSTCYLSQTDIQKYNIQIIPLEIIFGTDEYLENVTITSQEFYPKLAAASELPTTSQPATGQLIDLYNRLADAGYENVITITLAATISGFYNQICNLAQQITRIRIIPFDSQITLGLMGDLAIYAAQLAATDTDPDEIVAKLTEQRATIDELFVVDDLQNLVKGGRLSNASSFIGSLLNIKPILTFDNQTDEIVAFDKVRTMKRALKRVEKLFSEVEPTLDYPVKAFVFDANAKQAGQRWLEHLEEAFPKVRFAQAEIGPVIGTHLGAGALALGWERDITKL
ncbi:DegV family protein [Fructilactobacillus myrtifloralis]|uniref:DegV family protein n=1 Tax=Fructilactobacillus myrtifloralis TaxID=2940301 RepID=A0ABY5BSV0_9LACO|nr:DegV family protein [Fructilactobacillus myrtifloralis]USS85338.1 DegV family protein [Fructilactobacillus myrtifloralis]